MEKSLKIVLIQFNSGLAAKVADDLEQAIANHEVRSVNPGHPWRRFKHMIVFYQFVLV
ncbi:MAG: hypothetical protein ACLRQF_18345 [Thomasclavelia ramosa]